MQKSTYNNEERIAHKVLIGWELPTVLMEDGRPFSINNRYTLSLHENAAMTAVLQSWRGRSFTDDERAGFDLHTILGATCMLNVVHNPSGSRTYANVDTVTPVPQGLDCPAAVNANMKYSIEEHTDAEFMALPEWMRNTINRGDAESSGPPAQDPNDFPNDDVPF